MSDPARVRALFERVRDLIPSARLAVVLHEAGDDFELAEAVLALVDSEGSKVRSFDDDESNRGRVSLSSGDPGGGSRVLVEIKNRELPANRYRFVREIDKGGMGCVKQVRDVDLRRHLAMKVMLDEKSNLLPRFVEEAQVMGQLDHPNIVPVHELGVDAEGRVFFTMKLVQGETFESVCSKVGSGVDGWNVTRALSVILRICEAMAFAHDKGVLHRDLKPTNVMVGRFGEVYVMDWGLARVVGQPESHDLRIDHEDRFAKVHTERVDQRIESSPRSSVHTQDGAIVGTPAYMPPEQARGQLDLIGSRSDVYAVGALLYRLLGGIEPYYDPARALAGLEIVARVIAGPPKPLFEIAPDLPAELLAIQEKAMAREIEARYESMTALGEDLRAYLEHRVVTAYETGAFAELRKWIERNRALASSVALLFVVLVVGSGEISIRKKEVEARKAEFEQLAGIVHLQRAIADEANLGSPVPKNIPAMEAWLAQDARILGLQPVLKRSIGDLRSRARPWTEGEKIADRQAHPRFKELELHRAQLAIYRVAVAQRQPGFVQSRPALPSELERWTANELNAFAWGRVAPNVEDRTMGEEPLALVAAERAVAKIEAGDRSETLPAALDTLAWAYLANGRDDDAMTTTKRARETAPTADRQLYDTYTANIEKMIGSFRDGTGQKNVAELERLVAELEEIVAARRTFDLESESENFLFDTLSKLDADIDTFEATTKVRVVRNLDWARRIDELTMHHPNATHTWEEARLAIAKADDIVASKSYSNVPIDLKPQIGLVPLGMNPVTKLWEFYDLRSGCDFAGGQDPAGISIPSHAKDGSIKVAPGTGIVFVLLPGGTYLQGAQSTDPAAPNFDPGMDSDELAQKVTLAPFFLARHELTRSQWYRLSNGDEPSWAKRGVVYRPDRPVDWTHPVENVDWTDCVKLLRRYGMDLPTEARWEYGARGGTSTPWWTGNEPSSAAGAGNVLDLGAEKVHRAWGRQSGDFVDGYVGPSPVGSFRANGFGLFDTIGNVWEWCLDPHVEQYGTPRTGDGLRSVADEATRDRVIRSGTYSTPLELARSSDRANYAASIRLPTIGLRAARNLEITED